MCTPPSDMSVDEASGEIHTSDGFRTRRSASGLIGCSPIASRICRAHGSKPWSWPDRSRSMPRRCVIPDTGCKPATTSASWSRRPSRLRRSRRRSRSTSCSRTTQSSSSTSLRGSSYIRPPGIGPALWSTRWLPIAERACPGIGGVRRPGIVHRLDKDTSGLLVVAKTDRAHRKLAAQFADHGRTGPLERGYLAFVWGVPPRPKGTIDRPLDRHPQSRDKMAVREGGREAITHWEVQNGTSMAQASPSSQASWNAG